jgi:hypothetical protein
MVVVDLLEHAIKLSLASLGEVDAKDFGQVVGR